MKLIARAMGRYKAAVFAAILIKLVGTMAEVLLPYILEYMIDYVVPGGNLRRVILWGLLMFAAAIVCRQMNVAANRKAIRNAHNVSYDIRKALFDKTINLSGNAFDHFGLPSLISRMTSDSYNVQSGVQSLQALCIRAPMMLFGGLIMSLIMDVHLAMILVVMLPVLIFIVIFVSLKGIPLYTAVQQKLDTIVRLMRENITGIRVVKALSKEPHEEARFAKANGDMARTDIKASTVMAIPGPFLTMCLNAGLAFVVVYGAMRVNDGLMRPGVILAFLTYFNMIAMGVMGLSRIFMMLSKAFASASRIDEVLQYDDPWVILKSEQRAVPSSENAFVVFDHVSFSYGATGCTDGRKQALEDISFTLLKGESLGIIGPTGCGKTTIINLLMRFYDATGGRIFIDGADVRTFEKDALRQKFGVVFQNDMIFHDTLRGNIAFGREINEAGLLDAARDAVALEYIESLDGGLDYEAAIKGANLSGGQKQRLMVARALAGRPEILILDDSSSALDYKTDSEMRRAIRERYADSTLILIAQRVSSVMHLDKILVMEEGRCVGLGTHEDLMKHCPSYRETYEMQTS